MKTATNTADRELVLTRLLNAPRELVFEVWTNPQHIAQWWGPNGFTNTIHNMDVRPGGEWNFIMHGPDGTNYINKIVFIEVVKPERLVYAHGSDQENDPRAFQATITFVAKGNKTELTMHSVFSSAAVLEELKKFGAVEGGQQTVNRLEAYLQKMIEPIKHEKR
jgi:uncharacterized protein YndB with AHSA1/START domain